MKDGTSRSCILQPCRAATWGCDESGLPSADPCFRPAQSPLSLRGRGLPSTPLSPAQTQCPQGQTGWQLTSLLVINRVALKAGKVRSRGQNRKRASGFLEPHSPGQQVGAFTGRQPPFFTTPTVRTFSSSFGSQLPDDTPVPPSPFRTPRRPLKIVGILLRKLM